MKTVVEVVCQLILCIIAFILSILITLGIRADFNVLKTLEYWIQVASGAFLMIVVYNMIYILDQRAKAKDTKSRFYLALQTNKIRTNIIKEQKLYKEFEKAVEEENKERYKEACNEKIQKLTTRFSYDEIINLEEKEFENFASGFLIRDKKLKSLKKLFVKVKTGKIKYKIVKANPLLKDKELQKNDDGSKLDYNGAWYEIKRNVFKIFTFICINIAFAVITLLYTSIGILQAILTNATIFLTSLVSGFFSSYMKTALKTSVYENRNDFFERRLGITEKFEIK